jgi:hypothetical protein
MLECSQGKPYTFILVNYDKYMIRLYLAALHYNEYNDLTQAVTNDGKRRFSVCFPKYKQGGHIVTMAVEDASSGQILECVYSLPNNDYR